MQHRQGRDHIEVVVHKMPVVAVQIDHAERRPRPGEFPRPFSGYLDQLAAPVQPHVIHLQQAIIQKMGETAIAAAQIQHLTGGGEMGYNAIPTRLRSVTCGRKAIGEAVVEIAIDSEQLLSGGFVHRFTVVRSAYFVIDTLREHLYGIRNTQ